MELMEAIRRRRSIRSYQDRAIEPQKLQAVLDAGRLAPSARNRQDWRFVVATDAALKRQLADAASQQTFVGEAGAVIAACAADDYVMRCGQACGPIDVAIAMDHMTLKAVEEGLGTCWIGSFDPERVKDLLGIPPEVTVVELLTLGYPAEDPAPTPRMPLDRIACFEQWEF